MKPQYKEKKTKTKKNNKLYKEGWDQWSSYSYYIKININSKKFKEWRKRWAMKRLWYNL